MTTVIFSGPDLGTFSWKLSEGVCKHLEKLPEEERNHILSRFESFLKGTTLVLQGNAQLGNLFDPTMDLLTSFMKAATQELRDGLQCYR